MSLLHSDILHQTWPWHCVGRDVQLLQEKDNLAFELNFKNAWCEFCCRKAQPIIKRRNIWGEIAEEEIVTLFYLDLTCLKTSVNQTQLLFFCSGRKTSLPTSCRDFFILLKFTLLILFYTTIYPHFLCSPHPCFLVAFRKPLFANSKLINYIYIEIAIYQRKKIQNMLQSIL